MDREYGAALKSGALSAQPLMEYLGLSGAARASLSFYNTLEEVDRFVEGVERFVRQRR